eukprot:evm.model.scf_3531.1 EVM.evm.TU.scf_3531.1   scf_3531:8673-10687(+)
MISLCAAMTIMVIVAHLGVRATCCPSGATVCLVLSFCLVSMISADLNVLCVLSEMEEMSDKKLLEAEDAFQNSALLKELKERTEKNAEKNRRDIEAKYCARQAEIGVGDCGGLRDIPGMTKSGKQKTPQWLGDLLGMEAMEDVELLGGPMDLGDLDLEDSEEAPQGQPEDSGTVPESGDVDIELGDLE